jgi:hypothetical protein
MAELYHSEDAPQHVCWDRKFYNTFEDQMKVLTTSKTIYVGNLSFFTTEQQIHEVSGVIYTTTIRYIYTNIHLT